MKKNILYITLIISFIVIGSFTVLANLTNTTLSVSSVSDKKLKLGDTFTVNVDVAEVNDLKGYEYRIKYDTKILNATNIASSTFLTSSPYCVRKTIDTTEGVIWVACMMPLGPGSGVSGSGTLETIIFQVMDKGVSTLDLYRTVLGDHTGALITHNVNDGSFSNHPETSSR